MDKALKELIRISNATGKDPGLIQGGGGNTSVKTDDNKYMFIKASGTALKDMNAEHGWRRLRLNKVLEIVKDKNLAGQPAFKRELEVVNRLLLACDDRITGQVRPSIETPLHAILSKYVIHLHPVTVLSYACAKNGREEIEKLFKSAGFAAIWVPYTESGVMLANKIAKLSDEHQSRLGKRPSVFFLQKHGIFVSANSAGAVLRLVRTVIKRCAAGLNWPKLEKIKPPKQEIITETKLRIRRAIFEATGQYAAVNYFYDGPIAAFCRRRDAKKMLSSGALAASELLYASGPAVWIEQPDSKKIKEQITLRIKRWGQPPVAFLVKREGLFVTGDYKHAATVREIVEGSCVIRINASRMGGIVSLSKAELDLVNQGAKQRLIKRT
jgi:rhamnose utilization protein RhaD (predicted bifunctional aldolase and dehydrogenase)